jgi:hypothetical protein
VFSWGFHARVRQKRILSKAERESTELALTNLPLNACANDCSSSMKHT